MELHHIVPEASGGSDEEENCIPLCFNCHSDVGHYNSKHPKGRKYTVRELTVYRDKWFAKVETSGGERPSSSEELRAVDRELLTELRSVLSYETIEFLRSHDFGGMFRHSQIVEVDEFWFWAKEPSHEFFDADVEAAKSSLLAAIMKFRVLSAECVFAEIHGKEDYIQSVPREWRHGQRERFSKAVDDLSNAATKIYESYNALIRTGRCVLAVL